MKRVGLLVWAICLSCCGGKENATSEFRAVPDASKPAVVEPIGCQATLEDYCGEHSCPRTIAAWCSDTQPAGELAEATGSCDGGTWVAIGSLDQTKHYYYDAAGDLVAVAGSESDPSQSCNGGCRYACFGGSPKFDASAALACTRSPTWGRSWPSSDGGAEAPSFCGR
jgi:hypothetical protein